MKRIRDLLKQPEVHILLFFFCLILFSWPFLSIFSVERPGLIFIYLFSTWAIVIFLLFLVSKAFKSSVGKEKNGKVDKADV